MSIGTGVALFVIGAILAFAVHVTIGVIDLATTGYILMIAGIVVFVVGLVLLFVRRSSTSTTRVDPVSGERVTRRDIDGGPRY
ncbi:DUF6458 family protein [Amnibacterium sp. CER49]|uniref:DUF6458 family protein n=1 Tax=Amnibacterium sp. CER49 TaxID=3039161 RepID=UPI0024476635|nr:DUF6458 family protein [Amnibacterium sp. CER49]MDH2442540.1 DUF6458 family protein [Amnibacterium sp. CER49]